MVERKLATVLFVDLVDSTRMVTAADPEVVRRRVTQFFERVSHCVTIHGGIVEKFAGDAVLAAFGVPQSHEDDALRAARAAVAMRQAVDELGLEARIGIEAGELVVDEAESSFVTGEAVNLAARLEQVAMPGEILIGPTAHRLAAGGLVVEDAGPLELKGLEAPARAWRVISALDGGLRPPGPRAPLVGRDAELDLLSNTFTRTVRDGRAYLFTIYGEPGVGKSRLAREFVDGLERASVLSGRCLPYGEGVTYWPLAEMIKAAAGISDDDPLEEAFEKLRACCEEETVADVLGLAAGMLEALEGDRSPQEIAWAARQVMESLGDVQPLVLLFEDIHWAEEPMLDLIEHLADLVRTPLLIVCLARPDLLEQRPGWGGGRVRSTAIELEPLSEDESELLVEKLVGQLAGASGEVPPSLPKEVLERAEGNPLFVEEMIRMLVESDARDAVSEGIPDSLQALIAARIDHLPPAEKTLLQRASVVGRVFWKAAIEYVSPDLGDVDGILEDLLTREFLLREPRSSITGEKAYRFKHQLIREVAYTSLAKLARAQHHARFAEWLGERAGEELLEIRAYHLDQAVEFLTELEGAPPEELARETAAALVKGARRAMAREAYVTARKLATRSQELHPSLSARYLAARGAWRLADLATVEVEMRKVRAEAELEGNRVIEAIALTALGEAKLRREADPAGAQTLVDQALQSLAAADDPAAHFDALSLRVTIAAWRGDVDSAVRDTERAYGVAMDSGRKDLQTIASQALATLHLGRLELDEAELAITRALELAGESGSVRARIGATFAYGHFLRQKGEFDAAETIYEEVRTTAAEVGLEHFVGYALFQLGALARRRGDIRRAEKLLREATRSAAARGDRGFLPEAQAQLACTLVEAGRLEEAERLAVEAVAGVGPEDPSAQVAATGALGHVRAAQGRDEEAEELIRDALAIAEESPFTHLELEPLELLADFLLTREREREAAAHQERLAELVPDLVEPGSRESGFARAQ
jgi:class 3 adenylate cyclase/tetratricopeptide (TPR) repeat protein